MTQADLDTLARLLTEITPGPWKTGPSASLAYKMFAEPSDQDDFPGQFLMECEDLYDAKFIAHIRNHATDLLALARVALAQQWQPIETLRNSPANSWVLIRRRYDADSIELLPESEAIKAKEASNPPDYWCPTPPAPPEEPTR